MSLGVVRLVLEWTLLLGLAFALVTAPYAVAQALGGGAPRAWLRLGRAAFLAALLLPLATRLALRPGAVYPAPVEVFAKSDTDGPRVGLALAGAPRPAAAPPSRGVRAVTVDVVLGALAAMAVIGGVRLARQRRQLRRLLGRGVVLRGRGRLAVLVSGDVSVPLSARLGRRSYVVLPEAFLLEPAHLSVAIRHELGHLRSGDASWAHVTAAVRAVFPWNPIVPLWTRWLGRLEELACDERVCRRSPQGADRYGESLLWAAERARGLPVPAGPVVPMLDGSVSFLERRIRMLFTRPARTSWSRCLLIAAALLSLSSLGAAAVVAAGAVADRRLGAAEVRALADELAGQTGFRVNVDDTVVESLNRILADRDLRAQVRAGLERLDRYRAVALPVLERTGLPAALLALPLAESRVQPLQPGTNRMKSAGIWQFIPATARLYGLRVDETLDERYDVFREVEAAAAYLRDLYAHYGEWPLAIAAYNFGSSNVDAAIAKAGTRDVGALRKAGALNGYTSTVLASMLVMQRPALVDR